MAATNTDGLVDILVAGDVGFGLYKRHHWDGVVRDTLVPWLEVHDAQVRAGALREAGIELAETDQS